jgi:nitrous oxidase accessory protein NosD
VTLDLGGFTISGSGARAGVRVGSGHPTIQGPGTITNFDSGVYDGGSGATIQALNLTENVFGILLHFTRSSRVINNTIDAGARGQIGIYLADTIAAKIKGNAITGHSVGIDVGGLSSTSVIVLNSLKRNGTGLRYFAFDPSPITIRDNEFSDNTGDGVSVTRGLVDLTVDFNTITGNGGNGISVSAISRFAGTNLIGDDVVDNNGGQGIALTNISGSGTIQVIDNEVLGNAAVDLFWDGTGTNTCWKFNIFGSSDPATLPACP